MTTATKTKILVIDDHDAVINGTVDALKSQYPDADILKAKTTEEALIKLNSFPDRGVENKVRIVDFNQSFQVVDFVYLDGGYQGQKGSAGYSTFDYNSYPCSY